jgi:hypothetical protein
MGPPAYLPPKYIRAEKRGGGALIEVAWGYDIHEITLTARNWWKVKRGKPLRIRVRGFSEEGSEWQYWTFGGGLEGRLLVEYGEGGVGFDGRLSDASIEELPPKEQKAPAKVSRSRANQAS